MIERNIDKYIRILERSSDYKDRVLLLVLSLRDLNNIESIVPPPFGDYKKFPETKGLTFEAAEELVKTIKNNANSHMRVEPGFMKKLTDIFKISCEILDPIGIETMANVPWVEAMELYKRLFVATRTDGIEENKIDEDDEI